LYARATHILVNSPAYCDYLRGKGVPPEKITYIPYGTDVDMFHPQIDGSAVRSRLGLENHFIALYAGALGQANDIYTLLRAAQRLKAETNIRIVIFGDGKERARLQEEAARLDLDNVLFAGVAPKKEMPAVVASADVCVAILQNIPGFRMTYPNKVFDYMAAGRPTVLAIDGVVREVIETSGGGIFVPPGDDERLAQAILDLSRDPARIRQMGHDARAYLLQHLDRRDKLAETQSLFEKLVRRQ